ncbi:MULTISPECIES: tyrosine--tRNA ligase [Pseudothermotoga]|jgi:tyrosyl-tRNA synthetase|uniref:Tyrosine--tRNA ligase n=1 Tax=Pseudothermotoga lettingae (strain ATCC BAA-301 / DSM 14385 / NBRC 107922 / TMO) TaxID=416591 RepID=A8F7Z0_PSELT|nr:MULTISPECIES: tyrosine--tRNA ligase [Pseudothermotoga]ABV34274.1 tyrosyl-tRNA synthetase [Pseudothermotoga lettingae TMO]MDI3494940.1 tyrosyl-tRNA synthetase [Pseudothermotoga sp.]MDK2884880.1 tyrosyl-tRNA synthetase [Pseudothermotoga sp.]GLI48781.1 tyrosine--tRNA ligase [Pseudothermotoga lettingae TMO]HBJ80582.1 tyrosine--tRNA ligase [Pseudothermotoga sp.]
MQVEQQLEILKKNAVDLVSEEDLLNKLTRKKQLRVKLGVDPTRPDLHLGHAVVLFKLRQFQDLGHKVILIIGDFTAQIGDPSGRDVTRQMLSESEVRQNAKTYQEQAFRILDKEKTEVRFNSEWLSKMSFADVIKLASKYTVARMLERDDFSKRYSSNLPISISEFLYPLAQAYDSVAVQADVELGGTDQYFNLLVGRKIQEEMGQEPQVVLTMPIIEGTDGKMKMSKSYENYIAFNDTPFDMYGKLMSIPDELIIKYIRLLTQIPEQKINEYESLIQSKSVNPRDIKMKLAFAITSFFHGEEGAAKAENEFIKIFRQKELPTQMPAIELDNSEVELVELLVTLQIASSRSEARRLISQGAVKIDDEKITDIHAKIFVDREKVLRVGKRNFFRLVGR